MDAKALGFQGMQPSHRGTHRTPVLCTAADLPLLLHCATLAVGASVKPTWRPNASCAVPCRGEVQPAVWTTAEQLRLNFPPHSAPGNQRLRLACQVGARQRH